MASGETGLTAAVVVVVDDDPLLRHLARHALESSGLVVLEAENGQEGLALIARNRPDLVLLDVMMPVMDGYETCRVLRSMPELQEFRY